MPTGVARLQLASATDVVLALGDIGKHHWGFPEQGLVEYDVPGFQSLPRWTATEPLKEGDVYVESLSSILSKIFSTLAEQEEALARYKRFLGLARVARVLSLVGYIPVKVRIPRIGGAMTYSPHGRLVFKGHYGASAGSELDLFTFSMNYDVVGEDVGAMPTTLPQEQLDAILARWKTLWKFKPTGASVPGGASTMSIFMPDTWLDEVSYARIAENGKTTDGQYQRAFSTPVNGTGDIGAGGVSFKPLQVATAVTLDAQGPRGGRFGRFFLPYLAPTIAGGVYEYGVAQVAAAVTAALADTNAQMNIATGDTVELVVASARGAGENRPVRQVRLGNVPDTMRSRRNALTETYSALPFQSIP